MSRTRLTSWSAAQRDIAAIVGKINADPGLARAAMANPLLALEAIGYEIDPEVRREFEERIRFPVPQVARLHQLRKQITRLAGREVNPDSSADLHALLFTELKLPRRIDHTHFDAHASLDYPPHPGWAPQPRDPLSALRDQHKIIEPLLEYRALEGSEPRFCSREFFDGLRNSTIDVHLRSAVIRLHAAQSPTP